MSISTKLVRNFAKQSVHNLREERTSFDNPAKCLQFYTVVTRELTTYSRMKIARISRAGARTTKMAEKN